MATSLGATSIHGDLDTEITGVAYDSRKVQPGDLFVCIPGFQSDGHDFAQKAADAGAAALVIERSVDLTTAVPSLRVASARRALATAAASLADYPARKLLTVGITGTNGKTSTAYLCQAVLREGGFRPGLIGTIHALVGERVVPLRNTTPESADLQGLLGEMVEAELDAVVMEVSSHALVLERTHDLPFDVGVFTNLTQDHLDFHQTMENYFQAKMELFRQLGNDWSRVTTPFAVINLDDEYARRILPELQVPYVTYGFHPDAHVRATDLEVSPAGVSYTVSTPVGEERVELQLSGLFNVQNSLAAISAGLAQRIDLTDAVRGVESVPGVRGRFELVREGQDYTVVVDYAHTPDGLENLLTSARQVTRGRLLTVFGCGGDRDAAKRPMMGEIAGRLSDHVIATSDNPRSEQPETILDAIEKGLAPTGVSYEREADRASAIGRAIGMAGPGDTVVIAGKGHENYQIFADRTIHFDDVEVAGQAIRVRLGKGGKPASRTNDQAWTERRRTTAALEQTR
ncbi:MAG: UDP-N-acetylmuramoyl-L-alanyl-D-glutamate--2,6-diaminopimelate ligase [Vulcanimicrobiota bacterium]